MTEWAEIEAGDRYANRRLRMMEQMGERRAYAPVTAPLSNGPVADMAPGYGQSGQGAWGAGMVWNSGLAGSAVTNDRAMRLSAVFACWRILSDAISTLPMGTFTRDYGVRKPAPTPKYLTFEIPQMSRITYLCQIVLSILSEGDAFVATPRDEYGSPTNLIPLNPANVTDVWRERGLKKFRIFDKVYDEYEIMHVAWMVMPGCERGISPIQAARDVIDGALSAQDYGRSFTKNHAVPPAVLEIPDSGSGDPKKERERAVKIAELWNETHGGTSQAGRVGALTGGAKLNTIALSPSDAEWLDSKRFGVSEIARIYGVPPHLIADASNSTSWGSGLAEQNLAFGQFSLRTLIERIDEAHTRLLTTDGLPNVFTKLNMDALLRASLADRYASYAVGITNGFLTPNEARKLEDLPPLPGGDVVSIGAASPAAQQTLREMRAIIEEERLAA